MSGPEPYRYIRYTWWKTYDIAELASKLKERFTVIELRSYGRNEDVPSITRRDTPQIRVKADTLSAWLAPSRVILFQKESAPFTKRDMELREIVLSLYSHVIPGPLPFFYRKEPKFEQEPPQSHL